MERKSQLIVYIVTQTQRRGIDVDHIHFHIHDRHGRFQVDNTTNGDAVANGVSGKAACGKFHVNTPACKNTDVGAVHNIVTPLMKRFKTAVIEVNRAVQLLPIPVEIADPVAPRAPFTTRLFQLLLPFSRVL